MGGNQSSPQNPSPPPSSAVTALDSPAQPEPALPIEQEKKETDCNKVQAVYKDCIALQYDRWLHPIKHENVAPDYDECGPMFEAWKKCVIGNKQVGVQFRSKGE